MHENWEVVMDFALKDAQKGGSQIVYSRLNNRKILFPIEIVVTMTTACWHCRAAATVGSTQGTFTEVKARLPRLVYAWVTTRENRAL